MNAASNTGGLPGSGFLTGTGFVNQLVYALILIVILHITFFAAEKLYKAYASYGKSYVDLMPMTYSATDREYTLTQDPTVDAAGRLNPNYKPIALSDNERTGIEFTYSFFIFVNPTTFNSNSDLLHVFHKGFSKQYPLLGPGVYMMGNENTMRVYMNSTTSWSTHVDVPNLPVQKWVHVAIVCRAGGLEIFINGDLKNKVNFSGGVPYQNFQDIVVFSQRHIEIPSGDTDTPVATSVRPVLRVNGAFQGLLSRLRYFNYAISYNQLAAMMNEGPSSQMASALEGNKPPYFVDTWWTTNY